MRVKHNTENRSHFGVILKNQIIITLAGKYCNINSNLHNKKIELIVKQIIPLQIALASDTL